MKHLHLVLAWVLVSACARNAGDSARQAASYPKEQVWNRSVNHDKEVLICSPKVRHAEDRVVVRLRCQGKEVMALQSFQTPYASQAQANESVRIDWRDDGSAVVVNLLVTGGTQETGPYYIVWHGCSPAETRYRPTGKEKHAGETTVYFDGWDNAGKPIFRIK